MGKPFSPFFIFPTPNFFASNPLPASPPHNHCRGKMRGGENEKKGRKWFSPSYFFPKSSVFIFFPSSQFSPWIMKCNVNIQLSTKVCHILTNKITLPLFLFFFFLSPFSFPLFLLFNFVPHCLILIFSTARSPP